jgi:hypothetical protein
MVIAYGSRLPWRDAVLAFLVTHSPHPKSSSSLTAPAHTGHCLIVSAARSWIASGLASRRARKRHYRLPMSIADLTYVTHRIA